MSLTIPTTKLNEFEHILLYAILIDRNNKSTIAEIKAHVHSLWQQHNITFNRVKLSIPTETYFYQKLKRLVEIGYLEKIGKKGYRISKENYTQIKEYTVSYIKLNYGVENV